MLNKAIRMKVCKRVIMLGNSKGMMYRNRRLKKEVISKKTEVLKPD
jgi:hypothetical protein